MDFHIVKMNKDKEVNKNVKNIFLTMCDVRVFLTFTSLNLVLLWQLLYLFCSSIVINTPVSQIKMTCQEIRIIATGLCIANQLRDVNTICMRSWYIAAHIWKIYYFKIKVVPSMGTNCAPLLTDLFLYSYESEFLQKLLKDKKIHEARAFNFTYRYIDDVLSINNSRFAEFLPLIYPSNSRYLI
jgi:hypothetical protein